jgi:hypothetical protein
MSGWPRVPPAQTDPGPLGHREPIVRRSSRRPWPPADRLDRASAQRSGEPRSRWRWRRVAWANAERGRHSGARQPERGGKPAGERPGACLRGQRPPVQPNGGRDPHTEASSRAPEGRSVIGEEAGPAGGNPPEATPLRALVLLAPAAAACAAAAPAATASPTSTAHEPPHEQPDDHQVHVPASGQALPKGQEALQVQAEHFADHASCS